MYTSGESEARMSRIGYLERHFDSGIDTSGVESREYLETEELERISQLLATVIFAGSIPRRLGGDATDEELALDKKRARRVAHALQSSIKGWTKRYTLPDSQEIRRAGAQLDWERFRIEHATKAQERLRLLATWAIHNEQDRWGRSAVVRLENELKWVDWALRD